MKNLKLSIYAQQSIFTEISNSEENELAELR